MIDGVIFDLDGVLVQTEQVWDEVRRQLVRDRGGCWHQRAHLDMMGMSSPEWSRYMHDRLGLVEPPEEISAEVVRRLSSRYAEWLPLMPGAAHAVERLSARWPLAIASSSNRDLIDLVLRLSGLALFFTVTVSSEEVKRGKPAPDVYLEAARRLGLDPAKAAAVEDSHSGILSAHAAGMRVIAIPNRAFPPGEEATAAAALVLQSLAELTPETVEPPAI